MIELINVTKWFPTDFGRHYVLRDVSLKLPLDKSVGVIGPNGAGKSTLLRVMAGADTPNEGKVIRSGLISPPMGLTPSLLGALTGEENARFACRVYGMGREEMEEVVEDVERIANIGKYYRMPVGTYSAGMKQRVAFAVSMSLHYDYYLFDEIGAGGDRDFAEISKRMVQERLATSKFVITSHRVDEIVMLCQACIVLMNGQLHYFDDIQDGMDFYGETYDLTDVHRKIERKTKRREVQSQIDSGALPASKEERKAVMKEQRKQAKGAEAADGSSDGKESKPQDAESRKQRRKAKKAATAEAGAAPGGVPADGPSPLPASEAAAAAGVQPAPKVLARPGLPMAPRVMKETAPAPRITADDRLAQLRERLAQKTFHAEPVAPPLEPVPAEPEIGDGEDRQPAPKPRRSGLAVMPDSGMADEDGETAPEASGGTPQDAAVRAQAQAALRASRASRLLQRLIEEQDRGGDAGHLADIGSQATAAQQAAAAAAEKVWRLLGGLEPATAVIVAQPSPASRTDRKATRRQRRSAPALAAQTQS